MKYRIPEEVIRNSIDFDSYPDFEDKFMDCDINLRELPDEILNILFKDETNEIYKEDQIADGWITFGTRWNKDDASDMCKAELIHIMHADCDETLAESLFDLDYLTAIFKKIIKENL